MNKKTLKALSILLAFYLLLALIFLLVNKKDAPGRIVIFGLFLGVLLFVLGLLLLTEKSSRDYGFGVILASVLIFIIGLGVCGANLKI